ncbi:hypothetical protein NUKP76_30650 [Klebsiella variicola]|nr:hypothetical protein NUKP76_30650 [Klebsiella variicola]
MADNNPAKQDTANAKADAADFDIADPQPHYRHQRQHADRQCYLTHGIVPVNNIINYRDYDRCQTGCMPPGAQYQQTDRHKKAPKNGALSAGYFISYLAPVVR